jgi:tetratricopeptide (TPR) repeat protein
MRGTIWAALLVLLVMAAAPVMAAEEDVFDTKTAIEQREKGRQFLNTKKYDAAIEALEAAVDAAPDAEAYYLLGYAYYEKGKTGDEESLEKAKENFEEAYSLDPNISPNKFKPGQPVPAPGPVPAGEQSISSASPANKHAPAAAGTLPMPAAQPAGQPKQE